MVIGISGRLGSGKDTVGKIIQYLQCYNVGEITIDDVINNPEHEWWLEEQSKFEIKKFAGKLKQIGSLLTGIPIEKFEDQDFKKTNLEKNWDVKSKYRDRRPPTPMTVREFLQKLGTEAMRDGLHTNVWVNALFADYIPNCDKFESKMLQTGGNYTSSICSNCNCFSNWIITDMRFPNEMESVELREGITIRVVRQDMHSLEAMIPAHASETALDDAKFDYTIENNGTLDELVEKVREILTKEKMI
jgi:ABC-type oligopeptide transport system ATPase subunit